MRCTRSSGSIPETWRLRLRVDIQRELAILPLFFVALPQTTALTSGQGARGVLRGLVQGLQHTWQHRGLRILVGSSVIVQFFAGPVAAFLPLYVMGHFGGGAAELGWLNSALGAGLIAGGLIMSAWGGLKRQIVTSLVGLLVAVLCACGIGLAPASGFWFAVGSYALMGVALAIHGSANQAVQRVAAALEMRGRYFATSRSVFQATGPLTLAIAAPIAGAWGVRLFWFVAAAGILLVLLIRRFSPSVYRIEDATVSLPTGDLARGDHLPPHREQLR